ncbi:MAG: ATP-binding protein [Acidobacteria bacterium]|nr:ATP-binding protein [Acidobacteriota bacterium]
MMQVNITSGECVLCGGTGWRPVEKKGQRAVEVCQCRQQPHDEDWWLDRAHIPRRYRQCDFEDFYNPNNNPSLQMALVKSRGFAEQYPLVKAGLLFLGNPGVGKTHLAVAILKKLMIQKGMECLFCSFQELLQQIRDSYNPVSLSTEYQVLHPVLETELVVIDDLGANRVSDWVEDTVTHILNYRYNQKKATLLTSNLPDDPEEVKERGPSGKYRIGDTLEDRIGKRVRSRLYEMCEEVKIRADDFRQTVRMHDR